MIDKIELEEIQPTDENILFSIHNNNFNSNKYLFQTARSLVNPKQQAIYLLDGKWGSGKSFFLKGLEFLFKPKSEEDETKLMQAIDNYKKHGGEDFFETTNEEETVKGLSNKGNLYQMIYPFYFDAWAHDDEGDPLLSLIVSMTEYFTCEFEEEKHPFITRIKELTESLLKPAIRNYCEFDSFKENESILDSVLKERDLKETIKEYIKTVLKEVNRPQLLILVDELDRCKPSYAISLLEKIKHYFDIPGVSFVIAANTDQLKETVKHFYGTEFNGYHYLKRFFTVHAKMPELGFKSLGTYFNITEWNTNDLEIRVFNYLFDYYHLSIRDRIQAINQYKRLLQFGLTDPLGDASSFVRLFIIPLIVVLDFVNPEEKSQFISGKNFNPLKSLATSELKPLIFKNYSDPYFSGAIESQSDLFIHQINTIYDYLFNAHLRNSEEIEVGSISLTRNSVLRFSENLGFILA